MFKKAKKFLAVVLSVLTVFGMLSVAAVAADEELPVIYILGYGGTIYEDADNYNSKIIYPLNTDVEAKVKEAMAPCLTALGIASATGDYTDYCDMLYNYVAPIYEGVILNPDGTPQGTSGKNYKIPARPSGDRFDGGEYYYFYDWRLSPLTLAEELAKVIDTAASRTESGKVNIVARCYGANVLSAYLQKYNSTVTEKINKVVFYVPSTDGIGLIGRIFTGNIDLNANNIEEYATELFKYQDVMDDSLVSDFITVLLMIFEQAEMLDGSVDTLQDIIDAVKDNLIPRLVRDSYGSFPSFWAMIPDEMFEEAVGFVYNTDEIREEYAGTIEIIREYNETVQKNYKANLTELAEQGLSVNVVAKYNLPSAPLFGKQNPLSDAIAETSRTSFGATTADFAKTLPNSYLSTVSEENKKYISADEKIDASTCLFPETTWFIKNCFHDYFEAPALYEFLNTILVTDNMTVETDKNYPQYIDAAVTAETLTPVTERDSHYATSRNKDSGQIILLMKFITVVLKALTRLISMVLAAQ